MSTKETHHGYTIGDEVYVKPMDWGVLKGKITGFQVIDKKLPIIESKHPYKKGEKFLSAYDLDRVSKTPTIKLLEWAIVEKTYTYEE